MIERRCAPSPHRPVSLRTLLGVAALVGFAREAGAQPAPQPPPPQVQAETPAETREWPEIDVTGLLQARYQIVRRDAYGAEEPTFMVRRARVQVDLEPMDRLRLTLEGELTDGQPIRDAFVRYRFARAFEVTAGHFKRPFGATELDSGWEVVSSERGVVSDRLHEDELAGRDIGAMVSGRFKKLLGLRWALGAFDGAGGEPIEDFAGRLSISPGPFTVGGAAIYSRGRQAGDTYDRGLREAWAVEGDATLDLPFLFARFEATGGRNRLTSHEDYYGHFLGLLGVATGRIRWCHYLLEPGFKFERFDSSTRYGEDALIILTPLARLWFGEHLQLLVEGNIVLADDFLHPLMRPAERRFVVQLGGRT